MSELDVALLNERDLSDELDFLIDEINEALHRERFYEEPIKPKMLEWLRDDLAKLQKRLQ